VEFTVEFLDGNGDITIPTSASMQIVYTTVAGSTTVDSISMTPSGSFFTATWGSGVAQLGMANYLITAPGQVNPTQGQLRITLR
jgi:hypothetical protein